MMKSKWGQITEQHEFDYYLINFVHTLLFLIIIDN